ncbi:MAG: hypothetical protein ABFR63_02645 [Thermodesulfobacteriota bacterium]
MYKQVTYEEVRGRMKPGDIIAFSGKGHFSEVIKWATRAEVSHVGIVFESKVLFGDEAQSGKVVDVFESITLYENPGTGERTAGVQKQRLSDRIKYYDGDMWWLPLSKAARAKLKLKMFTDFLMHQDDKPYDMPQSVKSALDVLDEIPLLGKTTYNTEDYAAFFCSELACAALEEGKVVSNINASEVTPIDLCRFNVFGQTYYQIKGGTKHIRGYNSVEPNGFGMK